jgi:hypothetical protein
MKKSRRKTFLSATLLSALSLSVEVGEILIKATDSCDGLHTAPAIFCRPADLPQVDAPHRDHVPGSLTGSYLTALSTAATTSSSTSLTPANWTLKSTR